MLGNICYFCSLYAFCSFFIIGVKQFLSGLGFYTFDQNFFSEVMTAVVISIPFILFTKVIAKRAMRGQIT